MQHLHPDHTQSLRRGGGTGCETVLVTWRVDAESLARALRRPTSSNGHVERGADRDAELRLTVRQVRNGSSRRILTAEVVACLPTRARPVPLATASDAEITWSDSAADGWLHLDIAAADWSCAVSLRPARENALAYARTDLLQRLGIKGGRYEPLRATCAHDAETDRLEASA